MFDQPELHRGVNTWSLWHQFLKPQRVSVWECWYLENEGPQLRPERAILWLPLAGRSGQRHLLASTAVANSCSFFPGTVVFGDTCQKASAPSTGDGSEAPLPSGPVAYSCFYSLTECEHVFVDLSGI